MAFSALEALQAFGAGRQMAFQDRERQRREQLRSDLIGAYDVNAGALDPNAARQAYLTAGDMEGLQSFDTNQTRQQEASLEAHRDRIVQAAQFLNGVQDEATWQAARSQASSFGIDLSDVPANYDPAYVDGLRRAAAAFNPQRPQQPYRWRSNSGDLMEVGPDGQPRTVYDDPTERSRWERIEDPSTGEIRLVQVPMSGGGDGGGDENLPTPATPQEARGYPPGTRFRLPDGSIGTVPGGPSQPATGGFP